MTALHQRLSTALLLAIVAGAVGWGFWIVGSPNTSRQRRLDDRRVEDLQAIQRTIERMVVETKDGKQMLRRNVPASLDDVAQFVQENPGYAQLSLTDPETGAPYKYTVRGKTEYELCAVFSAARDDRHDPFWNHSAGRFCFQFDVLKPDGPRDVPGPQPAPEP